MLIPIDVAMQHLYAEEADIKQVERKLASAIVAAEQFMCRRIYATHEEWRTAKFQAEAELKDVIEPAPVATINDDNNVTTMLNAEINRSRFQQAQMAICLLYTSPSPRDS